MTMVALLMILLPLLLMSVGNAHNNESCPFHVSYADDNNEQMIIEFPALPVPVRFLVIYLNCETRSIFISDPENCLPRLFLRYNFSLFYPLRPSSATSATSQSSYNTSFFDCSSVEQHHLRSWAQTSSDAQDMLSCPIYVADPIESIVDLDLFQCTKMFDLALPLVSQQIRYNLLPLEWLATNFDARCLKCEHEAKKKKKKISEPKSKHKSHSTIFIVAGLVNGLALLAFLLGAIFQIYRNYKMKGEDHARVENFLKDYKALKPTRFSYSDIKRITHQFKEKLGEGAHGVVYKGKLSTQILVAVKILNNSEGDDGTEFINEVGTMGKIHHVNVVRLLGFCADGFHRALVYDFFSNGSLQNVISVPNNKDNNTFLGWEKLQEIALGIATGIDYLHQGCDQRILHFDINPHNVLLDDNLTPKISDFGLAKLCSKNRSTVSMTAARGTLGYMAPEVFSRNFGNVSYKSDIYSYGMLLLEMVGGRKNILNNNTGDQENNNVHVLYPDWVHGLVEGRDIHVPIDDEEGDFAIAKKLAIVGLWCIQWHPMHRPSMKTVMQMLQGEGDKLKVPTNPFQPKASTSTSTSSIVATKRLNLELEVIQELD